MLLTGATPSREIIPSEMRFFQTPDFAHMHAKHIFN